jgi:uncharacterized protein (DUF983 family)
MAGFLNSCPRCHKGPLFAGLLELHERCSVCGFVYEQEAGQHWGAMVVAYALGAVVALTLFFVLLFNKASLLMNLAIPIGALVLIAPLNVRISRMLWTHAMFHLHGRC